MAENVSSDRRFRAVEDFHRARRRAILEQVLARLTGGSAELLRYEEVRKSLRATSQVPRGRQNIPLDAIVGSVGRYVDFTRSFLPRQDQDEGRWVGVKMAVTAPAGLLPIEVYQIGQAYFVLDGNHRVSVARQMGATHIEAYVTEVQTKVPLAPDTQPDDLIMKAEYVDFLEHTRLDRSRPQADLSVTAPGQCQVLEEHIEAHRHLLGLERRREITYEEAAAHWYDTFYRPVVQIVRERGILRDFPDRTETDLYLWIVEHRAALAEELGWEVQPESVAADLVARFSPRLLRVARRLWRRVLDVVTPEGLAPGPPPGEWRQQRLADRRADRLFADILVAIDGKESGWRALGWALEVARQEQARLYGLHVVSARAQGEGEAVQAVQTEFEGRCKAAGVSGSLTLGEGQIAHLIVDRARWMDLVVLSLSHRYAPRPFARLGSGLHTILRRCPTPVVVVPRAALHPERLLLVYDESPKAQEALFAATYMAGRWDVPLVVVTVMQGDHAPEEALLRAQSYLEDHGIQATFVRERGPAAQMILITAEEKASDLIVMGGYRPGPVVEFARGSTVGQVLRSSGWPVFVCQ